MEAVSKLTKKLLTGKIVRGLEHYLTDMTSYGRPEDGLSDVRIEIKRWDDTEIEINAGDKRFLIEITEA